MSAISKCPGIVKPVFVAAAVLGVITALAIATIFVPPLAAVLTISAITATYIAVGTGIGAVAALIAGVILLKKSSATNAAEGEEEDAPKLNIDDVVNQYLSAIALSSAIAITEFRKNIQLLRDNNLEDNKEFKKILAEMNEYSTAESTENLNNLENFLDISSRLKDLIKKNNLS